MSFVCHRNISSDAISRRARLAVRQPDQDRASADSYTGVWRELQRAAQAAGIGRLGTHSFRHTYRSWLDQVGTQLAVQQKAMRHSDIRTTTIYGDVVDGRISQALEKVSELIFANSTLTARGEA
jgi:integrase